MKVTLETNYITSSIEQEGAVTMEELASLFRAVAIGAGFHHKLVDEYIITEEQ